MSGAVVRHADLLGRDGVVLYSELTPETAETTIDEQVARFRAQRQDFEWKVFAHDEPLDLVERLTGRGFEIDQREAVIVRDIESAPPIATPLDGVLIRRALTRGDVRDVVAIKGDVATLDDSRSSWKTAPDYLSVYVAYAGEAPVSTGWIRFPTNSAFASLWGGATIPEYRNRGLYTALVLARLAEVHQRGLPLRLCRCWTDEQADPREPRFPRPDVTVRARNRAEAAVETGLCARGGVG